MRSLISMLCVFQLQFSFGQTVDYDQNGTPSESYVQIFFSVPSPQEAAIRMHAKGGIFDSYSINEPSNAARYTTTLKAALNLGIYCTDFYYLIGSDDAIPSALPEALNTLGTRISAVGFNDNFVASVQRNSFQQDSLVAIFTDAYYESYHYFERGDRGISNTLITVGGWVESFYFMTSSATAYPNTEMDEMIAEEKFGLDNLISLIETREEFESDELDKIHAALLSIQGEYKLVEITHANPSAHTDPDTGITVLGGTNEITIFPETIANLHIKISALRAVIVK
jgi:hypothetical protein